MWEMPDKRVWFYFGPLLLVCIPYFALPPEHSFQLVIEPLLFLLCTALGFLFGLLCVRDGYSLFHPSITRENDSFLFWVEVTGCFVFGSIGCWKLYQTLAHAL